MRKKRQVYRYSDEFREAALEKLKTCRTVTELCAELGIHRTQVYKWRASKEAVEDRADRRAVSREAALRKENRQLKQALANKVLEADFFSGALQKVEARRRSKGGSGGTASTSKSES